MMAMAQYPHPGGIPGQGLTHGHPMGPGHPHGMPAGQPGMNQMQMGMGGVPGGPQVSQAGMMAAMPHMGPGGHAMNPQIASQLAMQQQHIANASMSMAQNNPSVQRHLLMQRQAALQAQQGNPNMMMGPGQQMMMANGMPGGPGVPRVNLPAHLQNQMAQTGMHPQGNNHMAQQQQQQHLISQQQAQIMAAQHAAQQHQIQQQQLAMQQSTAGPSPAPSATAQPPMRPPSQVQNRPEQQGGPPTSQPQPPQQPTPVQQHQPPPQSQPQPNQQQTQNQHPNVGQPQSAQQQQPGQQAMAAQQNDPLAQQRMMMKMGVLMRQQQQQNQQQQAGMMAGASMEGACTLTLLSFADGLSSARLENQGDDLSYWQQFVAKFFSSTGSLRQTLLSSKDSSTKAFEISGPSLAWYYHLLFKNGVHRIELVMERAQEKIVAQGGGHVVESPRTSFVFWYGTTHQVVSKGRLQVLFDTSGKITFFEYTVDENKEFIDRSELVSGSESPEQKTGTNSPKMSKKQQQQQRSKSNTLKLGHPGLLAAIERRPVGDLGVPDRILLFLEMAENFARMNRLFSHVNQNPNLSASETLQQVVQNLQEQARNDSDNQPSVDGQASGLGAHGFPNGPPNQRTPGAFASPAPNNHLTLPGGGMTASPAMMNHGLPGQGGVAMTANPSQGGSGNPSATASPNVTGAGKKRRASQVKIEDDAADKAKASPRMPNGPAGNSQKRLKA